MWIERAPGVYEGVPDLPMQEEPWQWIWASLLQADVEGTIEGGGPGSVLLVGLSACFPKRDSVRD